MAGSRDRLMAVVDREHSVTPAPSAQGTGTPALVVTATEAQNEFGRILDQAGRDQDIVITRHNIPRAVLVSVGRYRELGGVGGATLNSLSDEFDALLARMQEPSVREGTIRGFKSTPAEMGEAAHVAARRAGA
ncbi:hypothetical protein BH11GEM2_BH11GEM2_35680 [soil metagenome]